MSKIASALYNESVMHRRLKPKKHRLKYSMFQLLLDLDEIEALGSKLRLFSRNRFNIFSFFDRDHGDRSGAPARLHVETLMRQEGIEPDGGSIRLLTMPRLFGYVFNPLSVYFCYRKTGELHAILYEVRNTFGEKHDYMFAIDGEAERHHHACDKDFYVSPFMEKKLGYSFHVRPPGEEVMVAIVASDQEGPVLNAVLTGRRVPLTDWSLLKALVVYPLLTAKVVAAIHWEALLLWLKGVPLQPRPGAEPASSTRP
jgi:DUF1365 family protein